MTTQYVLTDSGELKELETVASEQVFTAEQIDDRIIALADEIASLQADLATWQTRRDKLAELGG